MNLPFNSGYKDVREAADAGLLLWRDNFVYFLPFFAVPFWICAFSVKMIPIPPYWSWIIIWLLKPLFDRLILHVISIRFFENGASMKRLCKGIGKTIACGLLGDLLWRRFSPLRSAMMPVRILEQNTKGIAERKKVLKLGGIDYCFLLTLWGGAVEITLLLGEFIFFVAMAELIREGLVSSLGDLRSNEIFFYAAWCFNYMLVETIYVCMGFSLYINSRIEVEGWDLEIIFRKFAEKHKSKLINAAIITVCLFCLFAPVPAFAADPESSDISSGDLMSGSISGDVPLEKLQNVLDSPDFGGNRDTWGIRLKNPREKKDNSDFNFFPKFETLRRIFASSLRLILVALVAGLFAFLFFYLRKFKWKRETINRPATHTLHEIPVENPKVLIKKAVAFYKQEKIRLAWGYCTAAAIISWQLYKGVAFPPNATESECAAIVNSVSANIIEAGKFNELINHWVYLAYAGQRPPEGSFEKSAVFCRSLLSDGQEASNE